MKRKILALAASLPLLHGCLAAAIPLAAGVGFMEAKKNEENFAPPKSVSVQIDGNIIHSSADFPAKVIGQKGKAQNNNMWLIASAIPTAEKMGCQKLRNLSAQGNAADSFSKKAFAGASLYNKATTETGIYRCVRQSAESGELISDLKITYGQFIDQLNTAGLLGSGN